MSLCEGCGEPLLRKSKFGPPPQRWCSRHCRHVATYHGTDLGHWTEREALAELLQELAPYGLTDECPARKGAMVA